jgi:hypothetical protein
VEAIALGMAGCGGEYGTDHAIPSFLFGGLDDRALDSNEQQCSAFA